MQEPNEETVNGSGRSESASGHVSKVKQSWREHEDFGLAYRLQNNEFSQHFDRNRHERRLMHNDICLTKEEQESEDGYAAAYFEQLRRDQAKEDERLALELQRRLDEEERMARIAKEKEDLDLAKRLQEMEMKGKRRPSTPKQSMVSGGALDASIVHSNVGRSLGVAKCPSGNRLVLPPGVTPELVMALETAEREPIPLPPGITPDQHRVLRRAELEEDRRLAEEAQDYELAKFLESKQKPVAANCVKPSHLLALTKGRSSNVNHVDKHPSHVPTNGGDQYTAISKKMHNPNSGSSQKRRSNDASSRQKHWERFDAI